MTQAHDPLTLLREAGFDTDAGTELVGGETAFYIELIGDLYADFLSDAGPMLTLPVADTEAAVRQVHSLKSSLRTLGAGSHADLAQELEHALRKGTATPDQADALNAMVARLRADLAPLIT